MIRTFLSSVLVWTWLATVASAQIVGGVVPVLNGGTGTTTATGTAGSVVLSIGPTLSAPVLGTPASVNLANATNLPISAIAGLGSGVGTWLATPSCTNFAAAVTGETGTGACVFADSPTLTTLVDIETAGVRLSAADGVATFLGRGNGNDESLTIDLDNAAANTMTFASGTGATQVKWSGLDLVVSAGAALPVEDNYGTVMALVSPSEASHYNLVILNTTFDDSLDSGWGIYQGDDGVVINGAPKGWWWLSYPPDNSAVDFLGFFSQLHVQAGFDAGNITVQDNAVSLEGSSASFVSARGTRNVLTIQGAAGNSYGDYNVISLMDGGSITGSYGSESVLQTSGANTITQAYGYRAQFLLNDTLVVSGYVAGFDSLLSEADAGTTIPSFNHFYGNDLVGKTDCGYFAWYNGIGTAAGVWRVNEQGIMAFYNHTFTDYTPCAANFERVVFQWGISGTLGSDNTAYIGVEEGGTGVMRPLVLMGSSVAFQDDAAAAVVATARRFDTAVNCADSAGAAACGDATAGAVVIDAGGPTTVVVSTTAVTANSIILLTDDESNSTRLGITCNTSGRRYDVVSRTAGTSFTIETGTTPTTNPACVNFLIIN